MVAARIAGILHPWQDAGMPATEFPLDVAALLGRLRDRLAGDIDVVVLVQREPGQVTTKELTELHTALAATGGPAGQLHCLYVAADSASDPERLCTYWFGDRMTQWQMKLLTQAELASAGVALYGPWPPSRLRGPGLPGPGDPPPPRWPPRHREQVAAALPRRTRPPRHAKRRHPA
jgi:hypothetical protein